MSTYQGWNQLEVMGGSINKTSNSCYIERSVASFTPINKNHTPIQLSSPMRTVQEGGIDSDYVYDIPEDPIPKALTSKGRKRTPAHANESRTASLTWGEYTENGDMGIYDTESHSKKMKTAHAKFSKTFISSPAITKLWGSIERGAVMHKREDERASQMPTPPDSAPSSMKKAKGRKVGPFKAPTIKKSSVSEGKQSTNSSSRPIVASNHQGWKTTEDAVKLNSKSITIAKTTLDKLATFRYKPITNDQQVVGSPSHLEIHGKLHTELQLSQDDQLEMVQRSSDHVPLLSDGIFYKEPYTREHTVIRPDVHMYTAVSLQADSAQLSSEKNLPIIYTNFSTDADRVNGSRSNLVASESLGKNQQLQCSAFEQAANPSNEIPTFRFETVIQPLRIDENKIAELPPQDAMVSALPRTHIASSTKPISNLVELSSNTIRAFKVPDEVNLNQQAQLVTVDEFEAATEDVEEFLCIAEYPVDNRDTIQHSRALQIEEGNCLETSLIEDPEGPLKQLKQVALFQPSEFHILKSKTALQTQQSDMDDNQLNHDGASRGFEDDEFDEGLDDDDLFGVMLEVVAPETQLQAAPTQLDAVGQSLRSQITSCRVPTIPLEPAIEIPSAVSQLTGRQDPAPLGPLQPSPHIFTSDLDDEFPMDDEAEAEMLKLYEPITGLLEKFRVPSSLQYPFENQPSSGEVLGKSLPFPPPKSRSLALLPSKKTNCLNLNKHSADAHPRHGSDLSPIRLNDDEDWEFIGPTHITENTLMQGTSNSFSNPRVITRHEVDKRAQLSSSILSAGRQILDQDKSSESQVYSPSACSMLDDSHEYKPLNAFARPDFPALIRDRPPIVGLSGNIFLRTCFRIGEMFREGKRCNSFGQNALIELFARVTFSSRDPGTMKQHFKFADLFHDRPPFPNGVLMNYKTTDLAESESKAFLEADEKMARCLGRLKRDAKNTTGWLLNIITIRETDWEEIKWTKRIVSAGAVKSKPSTP